MDICAPEGTKVVFANPNSGRPLHRETAREHLVLGREYTVQRTRVHHWHTDVYLIEVPDIAFNSEMFD